VKDDGVVVAAFDPGQGQVEVILAHASVGLSAAVFEEDEPEVGLGVGEGELFVGVEVFRAVSG
jgi:hypothetical protein